MEEKEADSQNAENRHSLERRVLAWSGCGCWLNQKDPPARIVFDGPFPPPGNGGSFPWWVRQGMGSPPAGPSVRFLRRGTEGAPVCLATPLLSDDENQVFARRLVAVRPKPRQLPAKGDASDAQDLKGGNQQCESEARKGMERERS